MATDYDAPRPSPEDAQANESLEVIRAAGSGPLQSPDIDDAEADAAESIDLPGADLLAEELVIQIIPEQDDKFLCASCFLVHHRSRLARETGGHRFCTDCEA
ncbi:dUTPase [Kocuria flava]|uniref:dUTPase n=1 Tax=Kocuria flava TaxID=446860 RepID=A0A0U3HUL3_9MICC|nr:DUF4193 family protein [Kocuria flava]ALU38567.1 dUTPase [Kocuria flava]GEO93507.1 hypothetical protein KFL01_28130 [Kocuria flava]